MDALRCDLIVWSEFIKISKFAEKVGVTKQAISAYIKYGVKSMSDEKIIELHDLIKDTIIEYFA